LLSYFAAAWLNFLYAAARLAAAPAASAPRANIVPASITDLKMR